jgi:hypothetical protein
MKYKLASDKTAALMKMGLKTRQRGFEENNTLAYISTISMILTKVL